MTGQDTQAMHIGPYITDGNDGGGAFGDDDGDDVGNNDGDGDDGVVNCPTRQSLLLFIRSLH